MAKLFPKMLPDLARALGDGPATRPYPANPRPPFPGARGDIDNHIPTCIFCGLCARRCPTQCIEVDRKAGVWSHDPFLCIYCGACVEVCPTGSLQQYEQRRPVTTARHRTTLTGAPPAARRKAAAPKKEPPAPGEPETGGGSADKG
ncbi:MAG: 4Fe-4S binding protein [Desulfovibrionaceae bacterium]